MGTAVSSSRLRPSLRHKQLSASLAFAAILISACGRSGGLPEGSAPEATVQPELIGVAYGRLVDVYGLEVTANGEASMALYRRDVPIGSDIRDQREADSYITDAEIIYDFLAVDPDTLQPRLFIPRDMTGEQFAAAFAALDEELRNIAPMVFGEGTAALPFSVVPRNACLRLSFSGPLGIDDSFFVERGPDGAVTGLRNTVAVQLLRIVDDPEGPNGFVPMPVRVIVDGEPALFGADAMTEAERKSKTFDGAARRGGLPWRASGGSLVVSRARCDALASMPRMRIADLTGTVGPLLLRVPPAEAGALAGRRGSLAARGARFCGRRGRVSSCGWRPMRPVLTAASGERTAEPTDRAKVLQQLGSRM